MELASIGQPGVPLAEKLVYKTYGSPNTIPRIWGTPEATGEGFAPVNTFPRPVAVPWAQLRELLEGVLQ